MKWLNICSNWLHQNHELAILACITVAFAGSSLGHIEYTQRALPAALFFIAMGVLSIKLRVQNSKRVPASERIWTLAAMVSFLGVLLPLLWPIALAQTSSATCLIAMCASCADRHIRYRLARERIQRRKEQQSRWRQAKVEVMQEWKDRLRWLAGVQHDMRQPLHAMGLLLGHPDLVTTAKSAEVAKKITCCQHWLQELAENTLEATRLELNESRSIEVQTLSSSNICQGLENWIKDLAESKGLEFRTAVEDQLIRTDTRRLKRVIGNLLFNAVQHSESGSIQLIYQRKGGIHQFRIKDNGPGLSQATLSNSGKNSMASGADLPKTGIGLYVVKRLCEELQWNLVLHNETHGGSTFVLELPDRIEQGAVARTSKIAPTRKAS